MSSLRSSVVTSFLGRLDLICRSIRQGLFKSDYLQMDDEAQSAQMAQSRREELNGCPLGSEVNKHPSDTWTAIVKAKAIKVTFGSLEPPKATSVLTGN